MGTIIFACIFILVFSILLAWISYEYYQTKVNRDYVKALLEKAHKENKSDEIFQGAYNYYSKELKGYLYPIITLSLAIVIWILIIIFSI